MVWLPAANKMPVYRRTQTGIIMLQDMGNLGVSVSLIACLCIFLKEHGIMLKVVNATMGTVTSIVAWNLQRVVGLRSNLGLYICCMCSCKLDEWCYVIRMYCPVHPGIDCQQSCTVQAFMEDRCYYGIRMGENQHAHDAMQNIYMPIYKHTLSIQLKKINCFLCFC